MLTVTAVRLAVSNLLRISITSKKLVLTGPNWSIIYNYLNNNYIKLINFDFSPERCHLISVSFHTTPHIPPAQWLYNAGPSSVGTTRPCTTASLSTLPLT